MTNPTDNLTATYYEKIQKIIEENRRELEKPGVISIEPGYLFKDGWITDELAIIVTVRRKINSSELNLNEILPHYLENIRVDVVPADRYQQLAETLSLATAPSMIELNAVAMPRLRYKNIPGDPINKEFQIKKPILCHVSPEAGWTTLSKFLNGMQSQLTAAMYDFNAPYIATELIAASENSQAKIELALDPNQNPEEKEIQKRLENRLQNNYQVTTTAVGNNKLFASAYHEKVAVRDSNSFWLSSGNWSIHSQPDIDPFSPQGVTGNIFAQANRDWHVIVQDEELAKVFEQYIKYDIENSTSAPAFNSVSRPDLLLPQASLFHSLAATSQPPLAAPAELPPVTELPVRVQPLLTPDNYIKHIKSLIAGANSSLYMQFQYIHTANQPVDNEYKELLEIVRDKTNQDNFDTRIIIGQREARSWLTKLKGLGFNIDKFKVQNNVHNKGIIVDGKIVVVGSHNWSGDGTLRNRDASLIIHNASIAKYFQEIFLNDWKFLAKNSIQEDLTPLIAFASQPTPAGMVRLPWSALFEE